MPWVPFVAYVCYPIRGSSLGVICGCMVASPKHGVYSSESPPLDAVSGIIREPGLSSSILQRKTPHKLVQGTCNTSSRCSLPLLPFCLSNRAIQNKTGMGYSGRFMVMFKSGKTGMGVHSPTALFPNTTENEFVESSWRISE